MGNTERLREHTSNGEGENLQDLYVHDIVARIFLPPHGQRDKHDRETNTTERQTRQRDKHDRETNMANMTERQT